jgi:hypothetical protein
VCVCVCLVFVGVEDSIPRNAFKPRVQPRKPLVPVARNASMTDEEAMGAEHSAFNQMFKRGNEGDVGLSPASEVLPVCMYGSYSL